MSSNVVDGTYDVTAEPNRQANVTRKSSLMLLLDRPRIIQHWLSFTRWQLSCDNDGVFCLCRRVGNARVGIRDMNRATGDWRIPILTLPTITSLHLMYFDDLSL